MLAIKGGRVITVTGNTLRDGTILIEGGKIAAVGAAIRIPDNAQVIDATGMWITPGLIDAHTHIAVFADKAVRPDIPDGNEYSNPITPQLRGIDSFNPHDSAIPLSRGGGFTTCYTGPGSTNPIGGTGFSFKLRQANSVEKMIIPNSEQMKMALGENPKMWYGNQKNMPVTRMGVAALIRETLFSARNYSNKLLSARADAGETPSPDFKLQALLPVIRGEMKVRIHCHRADDIITAIRICEEYHLDYSLEHATESYKIADILREKKAICVIGPLQNPTTKLELWELRQDTPAVLERAGVVFCLTADAFSTTRWLPTQIGNCMARGLTEKTAFESVTINPARLLGLDDRIGSLEVGKDADIAIFDGHPFSNMTLCKITIIDGEVYHNAPD